MHAFKIFLVFYFTPIVFFYFRPNRLTHSQTILEAAFLTCTHKKTVVLCTTLCMCTVWYDFIDDCFAISHIRTLEMKTMHVIHGSHIVVQDCVPEFIHHWLQSSSLTPEFIHHCVQNSYIVYRIYPSLAPVFTSRTWVLRQKPDTSQDEDKIWQHVGLLGSFLIIYFQRQE